MAEAGVNNRSAYIRKMILDGYIVKLNLKELREMTVLLSRYGNNLNQIAKKLNTTGSIYEEEIGVIQREHEEIWQLAKEALRKLSSIN